ncbi:MAG: 1-deoxy-D-xylulose-5-phosphate synthase [Gammaproteobacteria bacterium]|nr:MAG: 1-deoxy-D-xylulose-5-phosphate synthase [Gammaproteobacteria bacterium]
MTIPLLQQIDLPEDLRKLPQSDLVQLADELRQYTIDSVSHSGGHLAAGLGVIELTIALHYVFNTPDDKIVWDTGHQSYPHKILTGRRNKMSTIRKTGGLAGFPKMEESPFDSFGVGHSSTSISAALGMAVAFAERHSPNQAIAVIGDGAMTAGLAFEALNHAGDLPHNLLVILNDNAMSISENVGGLSKYLGKLMASRLYIAVKSGSERVLKHMPPVWELAKKAEEHVKGMIIPGTLFEELGLSYFGPLDGHDLPTLIQKLRNIQSVEGPKILHISTCKGKGYPPAEKNPCGYHGVTPFDLDTGKSREKKKNPPTYTQVFSEWLCHAADANRNLIGITPAMREGSGLVAFSEKYPDRYFDVGIAEQHAVTFAAGAAAEGLKPVVAIYSSFLQRAYDQLIHDVALQNLPVVFAIDRAGIVGPDGPTHAGTFDISFLNCIPNLIIMTPADERECWKMLNTALLHPGPTAVRYPRGCGPGTDYLAGNEALTIGKAEIIRRGEKTAILAFGSMVAIARETGDRINATVVNMRFVKPMDVNLLEDIVASHDYIVSIEENALNGGAGSQIALWMAERGHANRFLPIGIPDHFTTHGNRQDILQQCGLDTDTIQQRIEKHFC